MEPTPRLELGQFLKLVGAVATGGQAKFAIQQGFVQLNGVEETRRRKKLAPGDRIAFEHRTWTIPPAGTPIAADLEPESSD
ncbi:RNA-binding S4 domain-containing protein [Synechococcus sp. PCC 7336]|uniref:RNA-binding S4 domain-containing protein n=1 Tax=Synechococcus sp. PCC 7336 TaxID=195250 RepID=UPI00034A8540